MVDEHFLTHASKLEMLLKVLMVLSLERAYEFLQNTLYSAPPLLSV